MIRGSLVSLICQETLAISDTNIDKSGPATLTLMSSDVERICGSFENFHELWSGPIEVGIALWLLERQLSIGCIGPVIIVIGSPPLCTFFMLDLPNLSCLQRRCC